MDIDGLKHYAGANTPETMMARAAEEIERLRHECEVLSYWGPRWEAAHAENIKLRALIADIKAWDVAQYMTLPIDLRERIQAVVTPNVKVSSLPHAATD